MIIGLLKEIKQQEHRVALTPSAVSQLCQNSDVMVESGAGLSSGFRDEDYQAAGAKIERNAVNIWRESDLIIKVKEPQVSEWPLMRRGQIVFTYFHFASSEALTRACLEQKITALAYETLYDEKGRLVLLSPMSAVAGRMAAHQAAKYLEKTFGGKGVLMGGLHLENSLAKPARVLVLGGGVVGVNAAQVCAQMGAEVRLLELNPERVKTLAKLFGDSVRVEESSSQLIHQLLPRVDVIIGAVLVAGARAPHLIKQNELSLMEKGTVLIDVAIDQGGCFESSRATTHEDPVYIRDGIVHYCVANLPGAVSRSSSTALSSATLPYIKQLVENGLDKFLAASKGHRAAMNMQDGKITLEVLKKTFPEFA